MVENVHGLCHQEKKESIKGEINTGSLSLWGNILSDTYVNSQPTPKTTPQTTAAIGAIPDLGDAELTTAEFPRLGEPVEVLAGWK